MLTREDIEAVDFWFNMQADEVSDQDDEDDDTPEYKEVIASALRITSTLSKLEHVAWLRWNGVTFVTCDSDADGAFKVYRNPISG